MDAGTADKRFRHTSSTASLHESDGARRRQGSATRKSEVGDRGHEARECMSDMRAGRMEKPQYNGRGSEASMDGVTPMYVSSTKPEGIGPKDGGPRSVHSSAASSSDDASDGSSLRGIGISLSLQGAGGAGSSNTTSSDKLSAISTGTKPGRYELGESNTRETSTHAWSQRRSMPRDEVKSKEGFCASRVGSMDDRSQFECSRQTAGAAAGSQVIAGAFGAHLGSEPVTCTGASDALYSTSKESVRSQKAPEKNLLPGRASQVAGKCGPSLEETTLRLSESSALDSLAHHPCNSLEKLVSVLHDAVVSGKGVERPMERSTENRNSHHGPEASALISSCHLKREPDPGMPATHGLPSEGVGSKSGSMAVQVSRYEGPSLSSASSKIVDNSAKRWTQQNNPKHISEKNLDTPDRKLPALSASSDGLNRRESGPLSPLSLAEHKVQYGDGAGTSTGLQGNLGSGLCQFGETDTAGSNAVLPNSNRSAESCAKKSSSSFLSALSTESSFASAAESISEAGRLKGMRSGFITTPVCGTRTEKEPSAINSQSRGAGTGYSSRRRTNSTGNVNLTRYSAMGSSGQISDRSRTSARIRAGSAVPMESNSRPSFFGNTAVGRRLTAQNNMWSGVGSYEPLRSSVFHGVFPKLPSELEALCMQCLGTMDSPELRALTDIQKAAMALVAKHSVSKSAAAKSRIAKELKRRGQPEGALDELEHFLLTSVPTLIYFDIASLTPHLAQGGYYRSHFEIPQTDAKYLRKCNERERALYSCLYEHESVRPEHHPKYGYVSMKCTIQPPWEPQSGEACLILKDHVRVRTTISASLHDGSGPSTLDREPLVATLNNPWHVLEALGYDSIAALAAHARDPRAGIVSDIAGLVDCNVHGEIKLGKDVDAIAVPKCAAHEKAMFSKLQSIATLHMVPVISMEKLPFAVKDDSWRQVLRHLQHDVLLKKTSLGNTYGQI